MSWLDAAPAVGVALVLVLVPGLLVVLVAGVRGVLAAALSPVLSVAVVSVTAVVAQLVGLRLGLGALVVGTVVSLLVAGALRAVLGFTRREEDVEADGWRALTAGLLGAGVAAVALAVGLARGIGSADRWPQTFDAVFHLSAVDHVQRTGDGSALTLGTLVVPGQSAGFYPAAWHDLVAMVASWTGLTVPIAANAVAIVAAAVVWPLSCVALTRVAVGPVPVALAAGGVLAGAISASPVLLTGYGTLWPNALATALLPACLALLADLVGLGPSRAVPRSVGWPLLGAGAAGLALAHPNALVTLAVVGVASLVIGWWGKGAWRRASSLVAALAVGWVVTLSPAFDAQRATSWPARQRASQALGEWFLLSPQRVPIPLLVAGLTLLGCVVAARRPALRWLLAVHLTAGALFVLVAGSDGRLSRLVSGAWWDDPFRLAALVGLAGVPLAALGVDTAVRWATVRLPRPAVLSVVVPSAVSLAVVVVTGLAVPETTRVVSTWYRPDSMLTPAERAFVGGIGDVVPAGERVIGNPWNGAALSGPLADREAVFPHLVGRWDPDRRLLAGSLSTAAATTQVCDALDRLEVGYVLTGPAGFWSEDPRRKAYQGLEVAGHDGFVGVARAGRVALWRVTACP